jgi:hypothetical protein
MPKKVSVHRLAAQAIHLSDALSAALEGKYEVGLIEKTLGHCAFRVTLPAGGTRIVSITSRVLRGGRTSAARAEAGHYLIIDNQEVMGVVNTMKDLKALIAAGRVSDAASGLDEYYEVDRSAEKSGEQDIWGKRDEERLALAAEFEARIRRRRAGLLARNAAAPLLALDADDGDDAPEEPTEEPAEDAPTAAPAAAAAADRKMITSARRLRKLALAAAAEDAPLMAELAARRAALEARWAAEDAAEELAATLEKRAVPQSWEDEIDVDAI